MNKCIICLTLLLAACSAHAQEGLRLDVNWDKTFRSAQPRTVRDAQLLQDGRRLAIVGEIQTPKAGTDGFFALVDALNGDSLLFVSFDVAQLDDVLTGLAEPGDGTFYLVGSADAGNQAGRQGWLLRVDEDGKMIGNHTLAGQAGDDRFEKIVWLDKGSGLIAGFSATQEDGNVWMTEVDGNTIKPHSPVGDGVVASLVGMEKGPGCVWLCGYSRRDRRRNIRAGDVWVQKIDEDGRVLDRQNYSARWKEKIRGITGTLQGKLLMAGESFNAYGDSDVWLAEFEDSQRDDLPKVFGSDDKDYASALFITPGNNKWLVVRRVMSNTTSVQVYNEKFGDQTIFDLVKDADFEVVRLLWTAKNTYLLVGTVRTAGDKSAAIRLLCLRDNETLAAKGLPRLEYKDLYFDDESHDGKLSPGERGALRFKLRNTGDVPITEGAITARVISAPDGVKANTAPIPIGNLPAGTERAYTVWVKSDAGAPPGKTTLNIQVQVGGALLLEFPATVEGPPGQPKGGGGSGVTMVLVEPDLTGNAAREKVAQNKEEKVKVRVFSANENLKATDIKKYQNGVLVEDEKNAAELIRSPFASKPDLYEYTFTYSVQMKNGKNEFYIEMDGEKIAPITFNYTAELPNLHVLAIGIPYGDLKYTAKDARDFAQAMYDQKRGEFFNEVWIDTLTSSNRTNGQSIKIAFEKLSRRFREGNLKPNDYLVVFISGHGTQRDDGAFGIIPTDYDPMFKSSTTVSYKEMIDNHLNKIVCKKALFIDACHSGVSVDSRDEVDVRISRLVREANSIAFGTATFTSCADNQLSYEDAGWENGAFTEALLEALSGKRVFVNDTNQLVSPDEGLPGADGYANDNVLSFGELKAYLEKRVPYLVSKKRGDGEKQQTPVIQIQAPLEDKTTIFQIIK